MLYCSFGVNNWSVKVFFAFFLYSKIFFDRFNLQHIFTQQSKGTGEIEVTENGQVVKVKDVSICKCWLWVIVDVSCEYL